MRAETLRTRCGARHWFWGSLAVDVDDADAAVFPFMFSPNVSVGVCVCVMLVHSGGKNDQEEWHRDLCGKDHSDSYVRCCIFVHTRGVKLTQLFCFASTILNDTSYKCCLTLGNVVGECVQLYIRCRRIACDFGVRVL